MLNVLLFCQIRVHNGIFKLNLYDSADAAYGILGFGAFECNSVAPIFEIK